MRSILVPLTLALGVACSTAPPAPASSGAAFPSGTLVDLSHAYDKTTIFWPTAEPFTLTTVANGMTPGRYHCAANNFATSEHVGTHLGSPVHFAEGKPTVDRIPLDRLVGPAVVIDVTAQSDANADYLITVADLQKAETEDGP